MSKDLPKPARSWPCLIAVMCLGLLLDARAADAPSPNEATTAGALFESGNVAGALPIYERLRRRSRRTPCTQSGTHTVWFHCSMDCPQAEQRKALVARIRAEAQRREVAGRQQQAAADAAGISGQWQPGGATQQGGPGTRGCRRFFQRGEYDKALAAYEAVAAANPRSYSARLYAGDVHFIRGNVEVAAKWFQEAIALNPDIEVAHRYWGDALAKAKREDEALGHYIDAFVAEPFSRTARAGLQQWAERNGVKLRKPMFQRRLHPP